MITFASNMNMSPLNDYAKSFDVKMLRRWAGVSSLSGSLD